MEHYEFEEQQDNEKLAIGSLIGLAVCGAGWLINQSVKNNEIMRESQRVVLANKKSRLNDLEAKWFPSSAQKDEMSRLRIEIAKMERDLR